MGFANGRAWLRSVVLILLVITGQAAKLSIIDAPPFAVYQTFWSWTRLKTSMPAGMWIIAIQAMVCLSVAWTNRKDLASAVSRIAPIWNWLLMSALLVFAAAIPTQSVGRFAGEIAQVLGAVQK